MGLIAFISNLFKSLVLMPLSILKGIRRVRYVRRSTGAVFDQSAREAAKVPFRERTKKFLWNLIIFLVVALVLFGIFYGLYWLNYFFDLERVLGGPWPWLRPYWLPLIVFLLAVAGLMMRWLWKFLGPEKEIVTYSDLDEAWDEIRAGLVQAGIDITEAPLFLVLGRPASGIDALFTASRGSFPVRQIPLRTQTPIQAYAHRQGIFITAFGASLLGRYTDMLYEKNDKPQTVSRKGFVFDDLAENPETTGTELATTGAGNLLAEIPAATQSALLEMPATANSSRSSEPRPRLRQIDSSEEVQLHLDRLGYLCRRITNERRPYCTLNGLLVLAPFDGLAHEQDASILATALESDLAGVRAFCQTSCPTYVAVTDFETAPGFDTFYSRLEGERRLRLLGCDFPLAPDLKRDELPDMVAQGLEQFLASLGSVVFRMFQVESADSREPPMALIDGNTRLYELLDALQLRQKNLERLLARILTSDSEFPLGGCYLAATGFDMERQQGFAPGIFSHLQEQQNAVRWTPEALAEERDYQRWSLFGYFALACFTVAVAWMAYLRWR